MINRSIGVGILTLSVLGAPFSALAASEIWYSTIKTKKSDSVVVEYKGPGGTKTVECSLDDGKCGKAKKASFPKIGGSSTYPTSPNGVYGLKITLLGEKAFYTLYDITGSKAKKIGVIPYEGTGSTIKWSDDGNVVVFVGPGTAVASYNITTKKFSSVSLSHSEQPFLRISPSGSYISYYNYGASSHYLVRLDTGAQSTISGTAPSYLEVSENGDYAAYAQETGGYKTLYVAKIGSLGSVTAITKAPGVVEDYIFVGNTLFHLSNTAHPLSWDLYAYDPRANSNKKIESDVSYGDYLTRVGNQLGYLKIDGTVSNLNLYDPENGDKKILTGVKSGKTESGITRTKMTVAGRGAVLLSPSGKNKADGKLFVWLHGGPERQIAVGYHSYLSYAVYDELLEKLAASGAYVLKLDYTGSTGYGTAFQKGLYLKIGDSDIKDVMNAIAAVKKDKNIDEVYLIGNSYGGYLALKGINDAPGTVDGAISINGVSDWYGLISRIPSSPFKTLFEGVPDNHNMNAYLKASVYTSLDKLKKDNEVLVVYGTQDSTVPTWQSTQYLEFAKEKNLPVESLVLTGEEHILRKRASLNKLCEKVKTVFDIDRLSCGVSKK